MQECNFFIKNQKQFWHTISAFPYRIDDGILIFGWMQIMIRSDEHMVYSWIWQWVVTGHSCPSHNNTTFSYYTWTIGITLGNGFNHHTNWIFGIMNFTTFFRYQGENVFPLIVKTSFMLKILVIAYNKLYHLHLGTKHSSHLHGLEPEN